MRSIPVLSSVLLVLAAAPLFGDAVITTDATKFGRVVSFDSTSIALKSGCDAQAPVSIPWSDVLLLRFDGQCAPHPVLPDPAGLERCDQKRINGFKVKLKNSATPLLAVKAHLKADGQLQFISMADESLVSGARDEVQSLQPVEICPSSLRKTQKLPVSFCADAKQFAVNWSPAAVFNNQVFTTGASIYIDVIGSLRGIAKEDVRFAYQSALSLWAISLQKAKSSLAPELQQYIDNSTARGGNFALFTPPQVIRMNCAANALSIVKWYAERTNIFPVEKKDYVAMAQVQGRTVLLNANDNVFEVARTDSPLPPKAVSLITVFVHELGHSFGLPDRPHSDEPSVMDPDYVIDNLNKTLPPTEADTRAFAAVLKASIQGAEPGVFSTEECAGLRRRQR